MKPAVLLNADSLKRSTLKKESVDVTVTSPPYNVGIDYEGGGGIVTVNLMTIT